MLRRMFSLAVVFAAFVARASAQTIPFDGCGTLVPGLSFCSVLFRDAQNQLWLLSQTGGFVLGDFVRVQGAADPGCFTTCMQGGCISVSSITGCVTSVGTPFCAGDGLGAACPCANSSPVGSQAGCLHSLGLGGTLRATGVASLAADTVVLDGMQMPNGPALYFQGSAQQGGGAGLPFGDGLLCAGGTIIRLGVVFNSGGASQWPGALDPLLSVAGLVSAGDVRDYQVWFRDANTFCTSATYNLSNGLEIAWGA